ncbi:MAG: hypothetical protein MUO62_14930 [Anaerolineales bacterium]|nr:hypothetical protein [Anaerolineales bacterium]
MLNSIPFLSSRIKLQRGLIFGLLIVTALLAFELFNYSTTDFALSDLLGDLKFIGVRWATILSIAFCGIDFAGIARLFTPEQGSDEPAEVWYLFGAWMLAAVMNAMLTWWGVSIAILNHQTLGNAVVARETLLNVVPIFVAVMVWLIRVLIIGTISMAGDRLFSQASTRTVSRRTTQTARTANNSRTGQSSSRAIRPLNNTRSTPIRRGVNASSYQPSPKPETQYRSESQYQEAEYIPTEPTYTPVSMSGRQDNRTRQSRL